jgi:hypothetical protein
MRLSSALSPYLSFLITDGMILRAFKMLLAALRHLTGMTSIKDWRVVGLEYMYKELISETSPTF